MTSHTISYAKNSLEMQVSIHDLISRFPYFSAKFVGGRFQDSSIPSVTSLPWLTESAQPAFTHFISHGTLPNPTSKITSATLMILLELAEFLCSEELSTLSSSELSKKITKLLASKASVQDAKNGSLLCVKVLQFVRDRLGGAAVGAVLCSVFATTTSTNNFACLENLYLDTLKTLGSSWKTAWTHLATATSQQQREWLMERNPLSLTNKLQEDEDPMFIYDKQLTYIRSKVSAPLPIELKKCSNWCVAMDLVKIAIYSTSASSSLSSLLEYFAHHNLSTSFLTSANSKQTGVVELMALILHRHVCILSSRYLLHTCEHDQDFKRLFTRRGLDLSKDVETLSFIFNEHFLGEVCLSSPSSAVGILILVRSRFLPWAIEGNGGVVDPEDPIFSAVECFRKSLISFFANRYLTILETLATKASSSLSASPRSVKGGVAVLDFSSGFYKAWESRTQWIPLKQIFDMHDQDLREVQEKIKGLLV